MESLRPSSAPEPGGADYTTRKQNAHYEYLLHFIKHEPSLQAYAEHAFTKFPEPGMIKQRVDSVFDSVLHQTNMTAEGAKVVKKLGPSLTVEQVAQLAAWTQPKLQMRVNDLTALFNAIPKETTIELPENLLEREEALFIWFGQNRERLSKMETLNLSGCGLTSIPYQLEYFTGLKNLNLSKNNLQYLPTFVFNQLKNLQTLDLSNNKIEIFPNCIKELPNLTVLNLNSNLISIIDPDFFKDDRKFEKLKELHLSNNKFVDMPDCFNRFLKLTLLDLSHNKIERLEGSYSELRQLETLDLNDNELTELPSKFQDLNYRLRKLDLGRNKFDHIPKVLEEMNVTWLSLADNVIQRLEDLPSLDSVKSLHLENNYIVNIPENFLWSKFDNLEKLYLDNNELMHVDFSKLDSLVVLSLKHNHIKSIDGANISRMHELRTLDLSHNELRALPPEITNLSNLKFLDLGYNQLEKLPEDFWRLKSLQKLDLERNLIEDLPPYFSYLPLVKLNMQHNELFQLPSDFNKLTRLRDVDLSENLLEESSIPKFPKEVEIKAGHQESLFWYERYQKRLQKGRERIYKFFTGT